MSTTDPAGGFDDTRLDDPQWLEAADESLRWLAESGPRVRKEATAAAEAPTHVIGADDRPRAVVVAGADARLLRAVLEPWCPVPFVAWPAPGLPGWAGPLDLVVVLAPGGGDEVVAATVSEAVRRGSRLIVAAPPASSLAENAAGHDTVVLPCHTGDSLAAAVVTLQALHAVGLGPQISAEQVAGALDAVAVACGPGRDMSANPAKELALVLAESTPLVWGGSVLAARAGRRVAEALRQASGRSALAADARHLVPVLEGTAPRDPFSDPFSDPLGGWTPAGEADDDAGDDATDEPWDAGAPVGLRPALVVLDDGTDSPAVRIQRSRLLAAAERVGVRMHEVTHADGSEIARYAALLAEGTWAATYLAVGLGRRGLATPGALQ